MLTGITDLVFVLQRVNAAGLAYPFTFKARNQTEFTGDFETTWNLLLLYFNLIASYQRYMEAIDRGINE